MISELNSHDIRSIVAKIKNLMDTEREHLIDLDNALGDGDLGITMTRALAAANDELRSTTELIPSKLFIRMGMVIARAAPSTMGTLLGTGFMRGGKALTDREIMDLNDLALFFREFVYGIMDRGKAKPGDKTILDVLNPVADSLSVSATMASSLAEAINQAMQVADRSFETTSRLKAQHGRAAYYREASIGKQDAGARVGLILVKGFYQYFLG